MNLYSYVGNDPLNGTDPSGEKSYLGARPVKGSRFNHMYTVHNADFVGDPNATVSSWAPGKTPTSGKEDALVNQRDVSAATGENTQTLLFDTNAWLSMTDKNVGVDLQPINASDSTVGAGANATSGHPDYDLFPAISRNGANSNSAAASVANRATQADNPGAPAQALPNRHFRKYM